MSMKTYREALESTLLQEIKANGRLMVLRVGSESGAEESEYAVNLPDVGRSVFSIAWGAALGGLHPVLDLRRQTGCGDLLLDALYGLPAGKLPGMTVVTGAEDADLLTELPGVLTLCPETPYQAAGFMRAALREDRMTLLVADETLYEQTENLPESDDFVLLPLNERAEAAADEGGESPCMPADECGMQEDDLLPVKEEPRCDQRSAEPRTQPTAFCATRMTPCDLSRLRTLADDLDMDPAALALRCVRHVAPQYPEFAWRHEAQAMEGECAFLPPRQEEAASVWLGRDRLTVAYDDQKTEHGEAAALLRAIRRVLEKPTLLIYDREDEER